MESFELAKEIHAKEAERRKDGWKQARYIAYWIVNVAGKYTKKEIKETELGIKFSDEIIRGEIKLIEPEKMREHAIRLAGFHAKRFPAVIKRNEDGKPKIYGEN